MPDRPVHPAAPVDQGTGPPPRGTSRWRTAFPFVRPGGIALALLVRVVIFSSIVTLVLTIIQLTLSYRSEHARLEQRLREIEQANALSMAEALWAFDARQLDVQLQGILRLPAIRRVEVRETGRASQGLQLVRGESSGADVLVRESVLRCCGADAAEVGVLRIHATLAEIYRDLVIQALVILASNAAKTFLVAFFILAVMHRLATRHLLDLAEAVGSRSATDPTAPLRLRRPARKGDELQQLVDALNAMRDRIGNDATELQNANLRMSTLLDNMSDLAWIKDREGRFTAANLALAKACGCDDPGLLIGRSDADLRAAGWMADLLGDSRRVVATGSPVRLEEEHHQRNGSTLQLETLETPLRDANGQVVGALGVARDIGERRQAERDREARLAAEASSRAKSEFVAHVSHEIRNPMNAIIGAAQLAERSGMDADQMVLVRRIQRASHMLLTIVNDILDLSKLEAGRIELERVPVDPLAVLTDVADLLVVPAADKGIELRVVLPDILPGLVLGDPTRLRQVLLNLAANAVKFTTRGHVELALRVVPEPPDLLQLRFEVNDTGIGMPPDVVGRLFTPFTQGDSSTSRRFGGTGLGLAISRQLIRLMGGDIQVQSSPEVGSRFCAVLRLQAVGPSSLPAASAGETAPTAVVDGAARRGLAHVLLVEDNPVNREIATQMLTMLGVHVSVAEDGWQAIERVQHQHFDAVLMDCQMPRMDGLEATRRIRQDHRWQGLPIIALTGNAADSDVKAALAAGMSDHLTKPVDLVQLDAKLKRWIRPLQVVEPGA